MNKLLEQFAKGFSTGNPFNIDGYDYATDTFIIVRRKGEEYKDSYIGKSIKEECKRLRKENEIGDEIAWFSGVDMLRDIKAIEKNKDNYRRVPDEDDCRECNGRGYVERWYESRTKDDDCPNCDGQGVIKTGIMKDVLKYDLANYHGITTYIERWKKIASLGNITLFKTKKEHIYGRVDGGHTEFLLMPVYEGIKDYFELPSQMLYTS